ncbi:uncharacterized protein [Rhodnius prolixus]|uniref:uncharacterized protein n=1 Tax=Rhodnius prolixus TaxID=13249 RepID=UPI003D18EEA6
MTSHTRAHTFQKRGVSTRSLGRAIDVVNTMGSILEPVKRMRRKSTTSVSLGPSRCLAVHFSWLHRRVIPAAAATSRRTSLPSTVQQAALSSLFLSLAARERGKMEGTDIKAEAE